MKSWIYLIGFLIGMISNTLLNINKSNLEYMLKYLRKCSKDIKLKINEKIATAYNINLNLCDIEFL